MEINNIAVRRSAWKDAHKAFEKIRDRTIKLDRIESRSNDQNRLLSLCCLGELVAKVIYNETDPIDPFDEDSGWRIASSAKNVVAEIGDEVVSNEMLNLLCFTPIPDLVAPWKIWITRLFSGE
jgi:hypothetical protein